MLLKYYLDQGVSKAELSRRFGVNRRTIHYWIKTGQLDRDLSAAPRGYSPRPPVAHKLDPYKGIIDARLEEFPKLSAKRLFDEVRAAGYTGCYVRVNDYVRETRPREPVEPVIRFETPAGRQGQVDFGSFTLPWGRRHALVVVLGYSRLLWLHFYPRQTMAVLMEGLESAFEAFGGVPEELLFDQMRAVVLSDDRAAGARPSVQRGVPALRQALGVRSPRLSAIPGEDEGQGRAPDPLHPGELLLRGGSSPATTISTRRPRAGWRARPTCAGTARRGSGRWTASSATSGRCSGPWPTAPTAVSASGWLRSPRGGRSR